MLKPSPSTGLRAALAAAVLLAFAGSARADHGPHAQQGRARLDPHRGQRGFIRDGLGPRYLPYIGLGHKRAPRGFPYLPVLHPPIPPGPGDCLYETGRFPWQRG